eukprot:750291-Hanusia_phi.AAC.3
MLRMRRCLTISVLILSVRQGELLLQDISPSSDGRSFGQDEQQECDLCRARICGRRCRAFGCRMCRLSVRTAGQFLVLVLVLVLLLIDPRVSLLSFFRESRPSARTILSACPSHPWGCNADGQQQLTFLHQWYDGKRNTRRAGTERLCLGETDGLECRSLRRLLSGDAVVSVVGMSDSLLDSMPVVGLKATSKSQRILADLLAHGMEVLEKDQGKAGDWYRSCMMVDYVDDVGVIQGAKPLQPYLEQIANIETYQDMWEVMAQFQAQNSLCARQFWDVPAFFDWWVGADNLEPQLMNFYLGTGGLILPDYTFYTENNDEMKSHRAAYREFIVTQLTLAGLSEEQANKDADICFEIETELAVYQRLEPYVSLKNSFKHISQKDLVESYPNLNFTLLFDRMGISQIGIERNNIVVKAPEFYNRLNDFFGKRSAKSLIPYLRWHLVYNLSPLLSHQFLEATLKVDANLMGISKQPERWHKCVAATKSALPMIVDQLFIDNYFSEEDRKIALTMLDYIRDAFKQDLEQVAWMSEQARSAALEKLANIFFECGHPLQWDECDWDVSPTSYFNNSLVSCEHRKMKKLARLFSAPDRRRWSMSVMSVNSYYDNAVNGLFITAGMLQKPFFDAEYDMSRNFGGVGAIMGHELTHGFDNTGRKYDQESRLRDWWDRKTVDEFEARGQCIAKLYSTFEMLGLHVKVNR